MTSNTAGGDGQAQEEVDGTKLANDETLYKIQAMLETTKVSNTCTMYMYIHVYM